MATIFVVQDDLYLPHLCLLIFLSPLFSVCAFFFSSFRMVLHFSLRQIFVHFRLVLDRETGKPKGYGFCEYKDEETALSARRNLQGYEINGRQLRVDFAENDKNADRNREQVKVNYVDSRHTSRIFRFDNLLYNLVEHKLSTAHVMCFHISCNNDSCLSCTHVRLLVRDEQCFYMQALMK